jgi:hypothetical protein
MRYNVTATPAILGNRERTMRETRQCNSDSRAELMDTIALAVVSAMDNARKVGHYMSDPEMSIVVTFEQCS